MRTGTNARYCATRGARTPRRSCGVVDSGVAETYLRPPSPSAVELDAAVKLVHVVAEGTGGEDLELLANVSKALRLSHAREVMVLAVTTPSALAARIATHRATPCSVVVHGLRPPDIGARWTVPPYTWLERGVVRYCFAEPVSRLHGEPEFKKLLWGCIKDLKAGVGDTA